MPVGVLQEITETGIHKVLLQKAGGSKMKIECDKLEEARCHILRAVGGSNGIPRIEHYEESLSPIVGAEQIATVQMRTVLSEKIVADVSHKLDGRVVPNNQLNIGSRYKALQRFAPDASNFKVDELALKLLPMLGLLKVLGTGDKVTWKYSPVIVCLLDENGKPNGEQLASRSQLFLNLPEEYLPLFLDNYNQVERPYFRYNREFVKGPGPSQPTN